MFWKEPNRTRTDMPKYVELEPNRTHKREEPEPSTVPKPCGLGSCWFGKFVLVCLHLAYVTDHLFTSELSTEEREVFFSYSHNTGLLTDLSGIDLHITEIAYRVICLNSCSGKIKTVKSRHRIELKTKNMRTEQEPNRIFWCLQRTRIEPNPCIW